MLLVHLLSALLLHNKTTHGVEFVVAVAMLQVLGNVYYCYRTLPNMIVILPDEIIGNVRYIIITVISNKAP
jgi:hypothetical protein